MFDNLIRNGKKGLISTKKFDLTSNLKITNKLINLINLNWFFILNNNSPFFICMTFILLEIKLVMSCVLALQIIVEMIKIKIYGKRVC